MQFVYSLCNYTVYAVCYTVCIITLCMQFVYSLYNYTVHAVCIQVCITTLCIYTVCMQFVYGFTQWNAFNVDMHLRPASPLRAIHLDGWDRHRTYHSRSSWFLLRPPHLLGAKRIPKVLAHLRPYYAICHNMCISIQKSQTSHQPIYQRNQEEVNHPTCEKKIAKNASNFHSQTLPKNTHNH